MPLAMGGAAILGHVYTVFLGFRGGKGVATAAGVLLAVAPLAVGICVVLWLVTVVGTGYVSLGSIVAAVAFPIVAWIIRGPSRDSTTMVAAVCFSALIVFTHRANIRRLLDGTEARFGHRRKKEA